MKILLLLIIFLLSLSCLNYNESQILGYWSEEGQEHNIHHFLNGRLNIQSELESVDVTFGSIIIYKYKLNGSRINIEYLETKSYKKFKNKPENNIIYEPFKESGDFVVERKVELEILSVNKQKMILSNGAQILTLVKSEQDD